MFLYTKKPRINTSGLLFLSWVSLQELKSNAQRPKILALTKIVTYFG